MDHIVSRSIFYQKNRCVNERKYIHILKIVKFRCITSSYWSTKLKFFFLVRNSCKFWSCLRTKTISFLHFKSSHSWYQDLIWKQTEAFFTVLPKHLHNNRDHLPRAASNAPTSRPCEPQRRVTYTAAALEFEPASDGDPSERVLANTLTILTHARLAKEKVSTALLTKLWNMTKLCFSYRKLSLMRIKWKTYFW